MPRVRAQAATSETPREVVAHFEPTTLRSPVLLGYCLGEMGQEAESRQAFLGLVCHNKFAPLDPPAVHIADERHDGDSLIDGNEGHRQLRQRLGLRPDDRLALAPERLLGRGPLGLGDVADDRDRLVPLGAGDLRVEVAHARPD